MKKIIILILVCTVGILAAQTFTLEKAIEISLKNNYDLLSSYNISKISNINKFQAYRNMLPQPSVFAGYSDSEPGMKNENYGLSVTQPLFQGGQLFFSAKNASLQEKIAKLETKQQILQTITTVENYYYEVLQAAESKKIAKQNLEQAENQLKIGQAKYELNTLPENELLLLQSEKSEKQLAFIRARNSYEISKEQLSNYLNTDIQGNLEEIEPSPSLLKLINNSEQNFVDKLQNKLIEFAEKNNPALQVAELNVNISKKNKWSNLGQYLPDISLNYNNNWSKSKIENDYSNSESVQINASLPLSFSNTTADVIKSKYELRNSYYSLESNLQTVHLAVKSSFLNVIASVQAIQASQEYLDYAKNLYAKSETRFQERIISTSELLDANLALENAKLA
ncbi:MAG: TolC family protein, partial [Candidatus Cloacimonadota bacterium]|nr:TolC family protein [Candidatus Cloacimonadota bacterium]